MNPQEPYTFEPIGYLKSCFQARNGTPRQAGLAPSARATLKLTSSHLNNPAFSLEGLDRFSHVWLVFVFHLDRHAQDALGDGKGSGMVKSKVAPPRLAGEKLGLFATRSPHRPVPIGLSLVRLKSVEQETLCFEGIDLVDGTPVLDVKPYIPTWDDPTRLQEDYEKHSPKVLLPPWAETLSIYEHGLQVALTQRSGQALESIFGNERLPGSLLPTTPSFLSVLAQLLAAEPRSRYRRDRCSDRLYFVELDGLHVTVWFDGEPGSEVAEVLRIKQIEDKS
jgi:tRNA-Thr(GGU) m(6)t(6)A37 methyltransferase TsaA